MFTKDSVLNSLLALLTIFFLGYITVISIHFAFSNIIKNLDEKVKNEYSRYQIGEYIISEIGTVEKQYYQMALAFNPRQLRPFKALIKERLRDINRAIDILEKGGTLKKYIKLNMVGIDESIEYITFTPNQSKEYTFEAIDLKPKLAILLEKLQEMEEIIKLKSKIQQINSLKERKKKISQVKIFYKELPTTFIRMQENASRLLYKSKQALEKHNKAIEKEKEKYQKLEIVANIIISLLILIFGYHVIKRILTKSRELETLTKQAQKAEQNAREANDTKSRFLANMSHEIRTPLNAIIGFSEILAKSTTIKIEDKEKANIIVKSSKALLLLINDILDISKVESGKLELNFEKIDLLNTLINIIELYEVNAKQKKINLIYKADPELPSVVKCDETRLKQVLSNILSNAIKFTKESGKVTLRVKLLDIQPNKALIRFSIQDEGIGISLENQKKIFDPFTQADSGISKEFGGTGLGLSISLKIIKLMGSQIKLTSQENIGSTFYFDIELEYFKDEHIEDIIVKDKTQDTNIEEKKLFNGNVLVAEDNTNNQLLIRLLLEEYGLKVTIVNNGQEAVKMYKQNNYDLLFLDINMPIMDGLTALLHILEIEKKRNHFTPKIALTANSLKGDKERYIKSGMDDYLSKPLDSKKLQKLLNKYFNTQKDTNHSICTQSFSKQYGVSEDTALLMVENIKKNIAKEISQIEDALMVKNKESVFQKLKLLQDNCFNLSIDNISTVLQKLIDKNDINKVSKEFLNIKNSLKKYFERF